MDEFFRILISIPNTKTIGKLGLGETT